MINLDAKVEEVMNDDLTKLTIRAAANIIAPAIKGANFEHIVSIMEAQVRLAYIRGWTDCDKEFKGE